MKKILICLEVPIISQSYEVYVPDFLQVGELTRLLVRAVRELSSGRYMPSDEVFLCAKAQDIVLNEHVTLADCGIGHGDHLVMV